MVKRRGPPDQGWPTFLRNHAPDIAAMDFFVVPTIGFDLLYAFVIVRIDRRELVWINVTKTPTAEWVARQDHGGISLGRGSWLHDQRPRSHLWRHRHSSIACHGHSGQAYRTGFILAEWICRAADRIDPSRVLGSYRRFRRGPSAPNSAIIRALLQRHQDPSITGQGCAGFSPGSADREHQIVPHPRGTPSPLRPGLNFRYTQPTVAVRADTTGKWRCAVQSLGCALDGVAEPRIYVIRVRDLCLG